MRRLTVHVTVDKGNHIKSVNIPVTQQASPTCSPVSVIGDGDGDGDALPLA